MPMLQPDEPGRVGERETCDGSQGKIAFVTGGSGDLGGAIARALAAAGADVAISYVGHLEGATATVDALRATGRQSLAVPLDQRDPVSIDAAVEKVVGASAGWTSGQQCRGEHLDSISDLDALAPEIWDRILETNLRGPYSLARAFAPHLRAHGAGRIVNIAYVGGPTGEQQHRLLSEEGRVDPPHPLPRCRPGPRRDGQLSPQG